MDIADTFMIMLVLQEALQYLRRLIASFPTLRPGFHSRSGHVDL
jgi:hypothetical protein